MKIKKLLKSKGRSFFLQAICVIASGMMATSMNAQTTVQVGTGTGTTQYAPIYNYYNYSYSQQIYTAADLIASGVSGPATISKIRFQHAYGAYGSGLGWTVYVGNSAKTAFTTDTDWEPAANLTSCFSGTVQNVGNNTWLEITLTTPFNWNGIDNIVVGIDENANGYNTGTNWYKSDLGANRVIYYGSDSNNPNPASPPSASGRGGFVPNIQFDVVLAPDCSGTPAHTTITASNTTVCENNNVNLTLNGTDFASGVEYTWQYDNGTGFQDFANTTSTVNFSTTITETIDVRVISTCTNSSMDDISDLITINSVALPMVEVDVIETAFCSGAPVTINASGADTYVWSPATGLNMTTGTTVNANPAGNTTYTVSGTDANGCMGTATSIISPVGDVNASADYSPMSNCTAGNPITISASTTPSTTSTGNWEYRFLGTDGIAVLQDWNTTNTFNFIPSTDSVYNVYYQARNSGCSDYLDSSLVSIVVGFGGDVTTIDYDCNNLGGTINIENAFGQTQVSEVYFNDFNAGSDMSAVSFANNASNSSDMAVITPSATGNAGYVTVSNSNLPTGLNNAMEVRFDLTVDQAIVAFGFNGADGMSYNFGNDATPTSNGNSVNGRGTKLRLSFDSAPNGTENGNAPGIYLVYGWTANNAFGPASPQTLAYSNNTALWHNVVDVPVELIISTNGIATVTVGGQIVFDNIQLPASYMTEDVSNWKHLFTAGTGGAANRHAIDNFSVSVPSVKTATVVSGTAPVAGDFGSSMTTTGLQSGFYDVWLAQDETNTCSRLIGTYEILNTNPVVFLGNDTTICEGESLVLDAGYPGATYVWSNSNNSSQTLTVDQSGTYVAYVTNPNSCVGIGTITVNVIDAPTASGIYVQGTFPNIIFTVENPSNATTYDWDFGDNSTAINAPATVSHNYWAEGDYAVSVTLTNDCGTEVITENVTIQNTASIDENEIEGLVVYPNPASELVTISLPNGTAAQTTVHSLDGALVYNSVNFVGTTKINVQDWTKGVYFIHVNTENKNAVIKLMVK